MSLRIMLPGLIALAASAIPARADDVQKSTARPEVEVVFCLDTTGSMGGLIQAAKQKIWAISNVQCGNHAETRKYWQDICRLAEGSYVQIDAKGGPSVAIATPFDGDLAKINSEISRATLVFGTRESQTSGEAKKVSNASLAP